MVTNRVKICIFGNTSKTLILIKELLKSGIDINYVVTLSPEKIYNLKLPIADYYNLTEDLKNLNLNIYYANSYNLNNEDDISFFRKEKFDLGFVYGWQRLIPKEVLDSFNIGIFGMHGSAENLPKGRGRSPMNWAIIEGRKIFYTNLFKYQPGVDNGYICDTFIFTINEKDDIQTLHYKNVLAMVYLIKKNYNKIINNQIYYKVQDESKATYYPKRKPEDGLIDWEMDIFSLERFIRALTKPFSGAYTYYKGKKITILKARIFELDYIDFGFNQNKNGCILRILPDKKILVKSNGGILLIDEYEPYIEIEEGEIFEGKPNFYFPVNSYGYHDVDYETFEKLNKR